MKIILVIQSLIIIAGAIYIFTLQQTAAPTADTFVDEVPPPPPPPLEEPVDVTGEATVPPIPMPPSDAQMEWPIPDENLEVR
jgi:hypothetical protein